MKTAAASGKDTARFILDHLRRMASVFLSACREQRLYLRRLLVKSSGNWEAKMPAHHLSVSLLGNDLASIRTGSDCDCGCSVEGWSLFLGICCTDEGEGLVLCITKARLTVQQNSWNGQNRSGQLPSGLVSLEDANDSISNLLVHLACLRPISTSCYSSLFFISARAPRSSTSRQPASVASPCLKRC